MKKARLNDIGLAIRLRVKDNDGVVVDLSSATVKKYYIKKPDRTETSVTTSLYTDGTDGILSYATVLGDLDQVGIYEIEAYLEFGSNKYTSSTARIMVYDIINN